MLRFQVGSSSSSEVYQLEAARRGERFTFSCNCRAAENGQACKHRIALLEGDVSALMSGEENVPALQDLARGSAVARRLEEVASLDAAMAELKRKLSAAKKALGREMVHG